MAGRIRSIKPEFFDSPDTAKASPLARLAYIGLWCWADDTGRGTANLKELEGFIFPNDDLPGFAGILREVAGAYGVVFYEVGGRYYYEIASWAKHQRVYKARDSKHPSPASGNIVELDASGKFREVPGTSGLEQGNRGTGEQGNSGVESSPAPSAGVEPATGAGTPAPPTTRGHRLPDRWAPARSPGNQQIEQQFTQDELRDQLQRFGDYWRSQPGQKGVKTDWDATWRNWLRKSLDMRKPRQTPENARIEAMYRDAATRQVSVFQQIVNRDRATRQEQPA